MVLCAVLEASHCSQPSFFRDGAAKVSLRFILSFIRAFSPSHRNPVMLQKATGTESFRPLSECESGISCHCSALGAVCMGSLGTGCLCHLVGAGASCRCGHLQHQHAFTHHPSRTSAATGLYSQTPRLEGKGRAVRRIPLDTGAMLLTRDSARNFGEGGTQSSCFGFCGSSCHTHGRGCLRLKANLTDSGKGCLFLVVYSTH